MARLIHAVWRCAKAQHSALAGSLLAMLLGLIAPSAAACEYQGATLSVNLDGTVSLPADPDRGRLLFLRERDFDIQLILDGGNSDSSPAPNAPEPLWLPPSQQSDLQVRLAGAEPGQSIEAEIGCWHRPAEPGFVQGEALRRLAQLSAEYRRDGSIQQARRFSAGLWWLRWRSVDRKVQQWLDLQLLAVVRNAGFLALAEQMAGQFLATPDYQDSIKALAQFSLARTLLQQGDAQAQVQMERAVELLSEHGYQTTARYAYQDVCVTRRINGDPGAVDCLSEAARRFASAGQPLEQGNALLNRSTALSRFGRYTEARRSLDEAASLIESGPAARLASNKHQALQARLAILRAQSANSRGDPQAALQALARAEMLYQALGQRDELGYVQSLIGAAYSLAGDDARALTWYQRAERSLRLSAADSRLRSNQLWRVRALSRLERYEQALDVLDGIADPTGVAADDFAGNWRLQRTELLLALGRGEPARLQLAAIEPADLTPPQQRRRLRLTVRLTADDHARRQLQQELEEEIAGGRWISALESADALLCCAERIDSVQIAAALAAAERLLAQVETRIGELRSPGLRHALLRDLQELALKIYQHRKLNDRSQALALNRLAQTLDRLRILALRPPSRQQGDKLDALEQAVAGSWLDGTTGNADDVHLALVSGASESAAAASPTLESGAKVVLAPGERLLYPVLAQQHALLLWRDADDADWRALDLQSPGLIRQGIRELGDLLAAGHGSAARIAELSAELAKALRWAEASGEAQRVLILVDGQTAAIPFALFDPAESARALVLLQALRPITLAPFTQLSLLGAAQSAGRQAPLAQVTRELDEVAKVWSGLPQRRSERTDLDAFARALATPHAIVHVAAHGSGARRVEEDSGLWLSDAADGRASFLSSVRVQGLSTGSALVVLSACESGYSRASASLGMGGLAGALSSAGVPWVVGTRWAVGDRASRVFSAAFHQALAEQPKSPARALVQAQQAVRQQRSLHHPTHWSGWFLLQGGPQAVSFSTDSLPTQVQASLHFSYPFCCGGRYARRGTRCSFVPA